jgi:signal transduction histidine kinase
MGITLQLSVLDGKLTLNISDNGNGFDSVKKTTGVGLMNIRTRAALFNGTASIISSPGNGCELQVYFDISN